MRTPTRATGTSWDLTKHSRTTAQSIEWHYKHIWDLRLLRLQMLCHRHLHSISGQLSLHTVSIAHIQTSNMRCTFCMLGPPTSWELSGSISKDNEVTVIWEEVLSPDCLLCISILVINMFWGVDCDLYGLKGVWASKKKLKSDTYERAGIYGG